MKYKYNYSITEKIEYHTNMIRNLEREIEYRTQRINSLKNEITDKVWNKTIKKIAHKRKKASR